MRQDIGQDAGWRCRGCCRVCWTLQKTSTLYGISDAGQDGGRYTGHRMLQERYIGCWTLRTTTLDTGSWMLYARHRTLHQTLAATEDAGSHREHWQLQRTLEAAGCAAADVGSYMYRGRWTLHRTHKRTLDVECQWDAATHTMASFVAVSVLCNCALYDAALLYLNWTDLYMQKVVTYAP